MTPTTTSSDPYAEFGGRAAPSAAPNPYAEFGGTVASAPKIKGFMQGAKDDEIIRHYGYDPAEIKKAHLYSDGDLSGYISDPNRTDIVSKLADSPLGAMGRGAQKLGNEGMKAATHLLHAVGVASDADTKYADLMEKLAGDDYAQNIRRGKPHSELPEVVPQLMVPLPGGAGGMLARGAVTGAAAGATQPTLATGADDVAYLKEKSTQALGGAATGAIVGTVLSGAGKLLTKGLNYAATKLPEEWAAKLQQYADSSSAEAQKAAEQAKKNATAARDTTQKALEDARDAALKAKLVLTDKKSQVAATAKSATKSAQESADQAATEVGSGASLASSKLRKKMGETAYHGSDDLIAAAESGDGRAGAVLRQLQEAGENPDRIQRASVQLQNWATRKEAGKLYDEVGKIAEKANLGDVPLDRTEEALNAAIKAAEGAKIPDKGLIGTLKTIRDNIGAGEGDAIADNSYKAMRQFDDDLGALIRSGQKGSNALIPDTAVPALNNIRQAVRADLSKFSEAVPQLEAAAQKADQYYKNVRVPFKQPDIAGAGSAVDADHIYDGLIKAGGGDKAQRYYNALDQKGRAAVRYQMAMDAVNAATDAVRGTFDPQKFYSALSNMSDAHGIFFQGIERAEMAGLKKFAEQAILAQDAAKTAGRKVVEASGPELAEMRRKTLDAVNLARKAKALDQARRRMPNQSGPEALAMKARADQAAADAAKLTAEAQKNKLPLGKIAAGAAVTAEVASRLHMPMLTAAAGTTAAVAGLVKFLTQTDAGRRYLLAPSALKPGTKAMQDLLDLVMKQSEAAAARGVAKPNGERAGS